MHQYDLIIAPLISLLAIVIGFIVYLNDRKNPAGKVMLIMSSSIGIWILSAFLSDIVKDQSLSLLLNRIIFVAIIIFMGSLLYLPFIFPYKSKFAEFIKWSLLIFLPIFGVLTLVTPLIISNIQFESWGSNILYGKLFNIFIAYTILAILLSIIKFVINYIKLKGEERSKIRLFFTGLIFVSLINIFVQVVIRNIVGTDEYYRFGNYSVIIFVAYTAYAIIKHQLFNVKVILTETAAALLAIIMFVQIFLAQGTFELITSIIIFAISIYGGYLLIMSVIREIQQKEQLQDLTMQLGQANSHLQELDKMKTEFVSLASHELLTPVSAIEGYLSMLLDEKLAKVEDPTAVKYLDNVYKSAKRLARLVTDLLNISRIEEGRLLVEKQDVNLSDIIQQVVDELKFKAEEGKQRIIFAGQDTSNKIQDTNKTETNSEIPRGVNHELTRMAQDDKFATFGDGDKIKEIVVNLIGNSIKYSKEPGTITISIEKVPTAQVSETWNKIEAEIKARPLDDQEAIKSAVDEHLRGLVGDEQLLISVKDQGIGIPKEELPRLFKKFHRVGDYTTAESQGTGLGLYISRALVELNHGRIWADSEGQDKGSTFSFSLPLLEHKKEIQDLEAEAPKTGEQLKPLAHPTKAAEEL